jgi:tetratricopeptide (TPR) repeat protein/CHAT domain-containing protein
MWLGQPSYRDERRFLEEHLDLLDPQSDPALRSWLSNLGRLHLEKTLGSDTGRLQRQQQQSIRDHLWLLSNIRQRGGTVEAVRESYVNFYGGLSLELPPLLEAIEIQLQNLPSRVLPEQIQTTSVALLQKALDYAMRDSTVAREVIAELWTELIHVLGDGFRLRNEGTFQTIVSLYQKVLNVYTLDHYPYQYGRVQMELGSVYSEQIIKGHHEYLEESLTCYRSALQVFTLNPFKMLWATVQDSMGDIYYACSKLDQFHYLDAAISCWEATLQAFTSDISPHEWLTTRLKLSNAYQEQVARGQNRNLEQVIACYIAILQVCTPENTPEQWAATQYGLGKAYYERAEGDRVTNLEEAIRCWEATLQVYTSQAYPDQWITIQTNLATAYSSRIKGKREENLERALACYHQVLMICSGDSSPTVWATVHNNLGRAYQHRIKGERRENLEQAIIQGREALQVFTCASSPKEWATAQYSLGEAYKVRVAEERRKNLEQAISHYKAALQVFTCETLPVEWATVQGDLGDVYSERLEGEPQANLEQAIFCWESALQVWTADNVRLWASFHAKLGDAYRQRNAGERLLNLTQAKTQYGAALQIYKQETVPELWAHIQFMLGNISYEERTFAQQQQEILIEDATAHWQAALEVFTHETFPEEWAQLEEQLGSVYWKSTTGDRQHNLDYAVSHYEASLQFYTREIFPERCGAIQRNLGDIYRERAEISEGLDVIQAHYTQSVSYYTAVFQIYEGLKEFSVEWASIHSILAQIYAKYPIGGDNQDNIEKAIEHGNLALQVITRKTFPEPCAHLLRVLASVYYQRVAGKRRANLEMARSYYERALLFFTLSTSPTEWANLQRHLGVVYRDRMRGEKKDNLEQAIGCWKAALQVYSREAFPEQWALIHTDLGIVYRERVEGKQRANQEEAIASCELVLQVCTPENFPALYAHAQGNLGNVYRERTGGEQRANLERAIHCYKAALQIYTQATFPLEWSDVQTNLGLAYWARVEGERRENLEQAIAYYTEALRVCTTAAFPAEYALIMTNLGIVYGERIEGKRRTNLEQAIACYEDALQIPTSEVSPFQWAITQLDLGKAYSLRLEGTTRSNQERAIACYQAALRFHTYETSPYYYALIQMHLGDGYLRRIEGEQRANQERAIVCYNAALRVYTLDAYPNDYANVQTNLSVAYYERVSGKKSENIEYAISCAEAALQVITYNASPIGWAAAQANLANAYTHRVEGERSVNQRRAISCNEAALRIYTLENFPDRYAGIQSNLGIIYRELADNNHPANLRRAATCYQAALQVYTLETFPIGYAKTLRLLGDIYHEQDDLEHSIIYYEESLKIYTLSEFPDECRRVHLDIASIEVKRENWEDVHKAYAEAAAAEALLIRLSAGEDGRDLILQKGYNATVQHAFVLARLERPDEAAVTLEHGRAYRLAQALTLNAADPMRIHSLKRRERYQHAYQEFTAAQAALNISLRPFESEEERSRARLKNMGDFEKARRRLDKVLKEIHTAQDPADFLEETMSASTILGAASIGGSGHALVYLVATQWGGTAIAAIADTQQVQAHFAWLNLPQLTTEFLYDLVETRLGDERWPLIGGFAHAQMGNGAILSEAWTGKTYREWAETLHRACKDVGKVGTLDIAAQKCLTHPTMSHLIDQPFAEMGDQRFLDNRLGEAFLSLELKRCLNALAEVVMYPLVAWLRSEGVTSLTLIPCGWLAIFPLAAVPFADGYTVGETLPTSITPNVRTLLQRGQKVSSRAGVYALGNPHPTSQDLRLSEAEVYTIGRIAHSQNLPAEVRVREHATREWMLQILFEGYVVDASCHGMFNQQDFLQSSLLLAQDKQLTLAQLLSYEADLRGLRLLMLSACQTAILDLRGTVDEVRSLAVGMLQAGAMAVLAPLWEVKDMATFLLMVRFAQEWLPEMESEPPASALACAQRWLRTVTNRDLLAWCAASLPALSKEKQEEFRQQGRSSDTLRSAAFLVQRVAEVKSCQEPDACPYADSIYWAGFQVIGW